MIYDPNMARWPAMVTGHTNDRRPVDIAYAALVEAGRPDLALLIVWYDDDDCGGYLEVNDLILTEDDWDLVDKAEVIARAFIDLPPLDRPAWTTVGRLMMAPVVENRS